MTLYFRNKPFRHNWKQQWRIQAVQGSPRSFTVDQSDLPPWPTDFVGATVLCSSLITVANKATINIRNACFMTLQWITVKRGQKGENTEIIQHIIREEWIMARRGFMNDQSESVIGSLFMTLNRFTMHLDFQDKEKWKKLRNISIFSSIPFPFTSFVRPWTQQRTGSFQA